MSLTVVVLVAEVAGGLWTHSLALRSDAAARLLQPVLAFPFRVPES